MPIVSKALLAITLRNAYVYYYPYTEILQSIKHFGEVPVILGWDICVNTSTNKPDNPLVFSFSLEPIPQSAIDYSLLTL